MTPTDPLVPPMDAARWLDALPRPVALTGGTGFVGSHLVETLAAAGLEPRVLVRTPESPRWIAGAKMRVVPGALDDVGALETLVEGAGTVVHLAGVVRAGRTVDFDRANRGGTERLVAAVAARAPSARLVYVSSLAAVGPAATPAGIGPEAEPRPLSAYGRSKLAAEQSVASSVGLRWWTIVRPSAVYGPRDTDVLAFFRMAAAGVAAVPAGERWVTVVHVADVVRGILAAAAAGEHGSTYHLGEPRPYEIGDLVRRLAASGGVEVRVMRVPGAVLTFAGVGGSLLHRLGLTGIPMTRDKARELVARHWCSRTAESLEALGVGDGLTFEDGARATWAWYRETGWLR
jgi:nucleoside-diphosphate-sugar epimerase